MDIPKYFDNVVLAQYVVTGIPLKVYVNGQYLIIPDVDEIADPLIGSGMNVDGEMEQFDYRMIDHLLVGGNVIDLATYTKALAGDTPEKDSEKKEDEEETKEESVNEGFKSEYQGNDNIIWKKGKTRGGVTNFTPYYKGHNIDFGGHNFKTEKDLKDFIKDYILSNQLYNKYRYESVNERADYKYLTQTILDAKPKHNVYYNSAHNKVNIGGVGYDGGDLVKNFNQKSGSSSKIKNNFYYANEDPQKTKREVEKLSNGKIKVDIQKGYGGKPMPVYIMKESVNEAKGFYLKVALRDAKKALSILDDMYRKEFDISGSDTYYFKDEDVAYDAKMDLSARDIEVTDTNIEENANKSLKLSDVMSEISKDEFDAQMDALSAEEEAGKAKIKAAKDKMNALKKQPIEDGVIKEDHHYTFGVGDIVKNKNTSCPHHGSMGVVQKIMNLANDMGKVVKYRVVNSGPTYSPGDVLVKTLDQLESVN